MLLALLVAAFVASGCGPSPARERLHTPKEPFAELPGLRASEHPELRRELARLLDEHATPLLVQRAAVPMEQNAAAPLTGLFSLDDLDYLERRSAAIAALGGLPLAGEALEQGASMLAGHEHQLDVTRRALDRPRCDLGIDPARGALADLSLVRTARLAARWEAFAASRALAKRDLSGAIESLVRSLRWAEHLAHERHVVSRIEGAYARIEALSIVAHLVEQPGVTQDDQAYLAHLIAYQLDRWPADAEAWIGDRAQGMYTYEMARQRKILRLLTPEEIAQFEAEGLAGRFRRFIPSELDADEWFYLAAMRRLIEACRRPYFERDEAFATLHAELADLEAQERYPLIAARLLLADVEHAQRVQAEDRATCEAYCIALSLAAGHARPPYATNPLTGTAYEVTDEVSRVSVRPVGGVSPGSKTAIVPRATLR
ncbi:MAG: hypothetical protein KF708_14335 [Pirellulales bacterium]|nr:hypothetical protein [Pirellulales bacterium]